MSFPPSRRLAHLFQTVKHETLAFRLENDLAIFSDDVPSHNVIPAQHFNLLLL